MRHGRHVKKLGVKTAHRKAMLSNMANSLITHGKIKTLTTRAKVIQGNVDRLITLAKRGDLHARRQAFATLRDDVTVKKLFSEIASEFKNMNGGYTRRAFFGYRLGDGASLSIVELNVERKVVVEPKKKGKEEPTDEAKAEMKGKEPSVKKEKKLKAEKKPKAEKADSTKKEKSEKGGKKKKAAAK
jgi:large subunit ribosomal protein L17